MDRADRRHEAESSAQAFLKRCRAKLDVALQPIVELQTGALYGVEALTRGWREIGYDGPHDLFDAAADLGVLEELEANQIEKAVLKTERLDAPVPPHLFVNIDTRLLLTSMRVIDHVEAVARRVGRPRQLLTIELSERHDKAGERTVLDRIREIRRRGFLLALDDFGVGVSDMRSLHDFEIDVMKIDRFFVDGVATDRRKRFLVGRMIELAHLLGQKAVCEGVEREEDLQVCRDLGADLAQGYHLGRPETDLSRLRMRPHRPFGEALRDELPPAGDMVLSNLQRIEPLLHSSPLFAVIERFRQPGHPPHCPIVGDHGEPMGVVREADLRRFAFSPHGLDLLRNLNQPVKIADMLRRYPVADAGTDGARLAELLCDGDCDGIVITEGVRYLGFLPAAALVRLAHERSLAAAQDANPLTGLPGNRVVSAFLENATRKGGERVYCYFDFDCFKPFNDAYGFRIGDRAITLFADLLKQVFCGPENVICHVGGDDFFVGALADPGECLRERFLRAAIEARARFSRDAESLYCQEHREAGGVVARDRTGSERFYPLLSCSVGVIFAGADAARTLDGLAREIADIKRRAKASPSGVAAIDLTAEHRNATDICVLDGFGSRPGSPVAAKAATARA